MLGKERKLLLLSSSMKSSPIFRLKVIKLGVLKADREQPTDLSNSLRKKELFLSFYTIV